MLHSLITCKSLSQNICTEMTSAASDVQNHLQVALGCPELLDTCKRLTQLIDTCGTPFFGLIFQKLLEDIFIVRPYKWGLTKVGMPQMDSILVRDFLGIHGPMFRLIGRMQQHGIQSQGPDVARSDPFSSYESFRTLTAFEAYFSHFAQFIKRQPIIRPNEMFALDSGSRFNMRMPEPEDTSYFILLDEYLSFYYPSTPGVKPPKINVGIPFRASPKPHHSIAKSSLLLRQDSTKPNASGRTSYGEEWCCNVLTNIFSLYWLDDYQSKAKSSPGITESGAALPQLPTENHVRSIRILVKYIHYFCNSYMETTLSKRFQNDSHLDQVNQSIMDKFQPKLFSFLNYCFDFWPLDHTFRIVLETWLSYIQPWRYGSGGSTTDARPECTVHNNWYHFVYLNLKFYTTLFQIVIKRFIRMDIGTAGNSLLLFRVAKIYSQPNLITLIDQSKEVTSHGTELSQDYYNSYIGLKSGAVEEKDEDMDMFSPLFTNIVKQLLIIISQALETLNLSHADSNSNWCNQVLAFLGYSALVENPVNHPTLASDKTNTEKNLNYAMNALADMYELPVPKIGMKAAGAFNNAAEDIADHEVDENGRITLSPRGRFQLQNNMKKFPIVPNTDAELRPICSYEIAFLVRFFYSLSSRFNTKYQADIEALCKNRNIFGKFCRTLFCPDDEYPTLARSSRPKPRLSLRFLAHYRNPFYVAVLYILSRLFGFHFILVVFYMAFLLVIGVFLKALFRKD